MTDLTHKIATFVELLFFWALPDSLLRRRLSRTSHIVFIYQMGKVASSTVYSTLRREIGIKALHFHRMPGSYQGEVYSQLRGDRFIRFPLLQDMTSSFAARLVRLLPEKISIVTLVREPVSRNVSAFFQNFDHFTSGLDDTSDIKQLFDVFLADYQHDTAAQWFDVEFKPNIGIDIYQHAYDRDAGFGVSRDSRFPLAVLRHDLSDGRKLEVLELLLGVTLNELRVRNVGNDKSYSEKYNQFKSQIQVPQEYVERQLSTRYFNHFFTEQDRQRVIATWCSDKTGR